MRKKLLLLFVLFVTIPIIIIYTVATHIFNTRAESNLKDIYTNDIKNIAQIAENYFAESLELTMYPLLESNLYAFYTTPSDDADFDAISSNAHTILTSSPYVFGGNRGVIMQRKDGIRITTTSNYRSNQSITDEEMAQADFRGGSCYWEFKKYGSSSLFTITRLIKSKSNLTRHLGYIQTSVSNYELVNLIHSAAIENDFTYFIVNENNEVILTTNKTHDFSGLMERYDFNVLHTLALRPDSTILDGNHFLSAREIKDTPYVICSIINPDVFSTTRSTLSSILSWVAIITSFFFVLLALIFSNSIVKPLQELGNSMKSIADENFSVKIHVKGNDEIALLADQFNKMAARLEYLYNQVYMREIELNKSQIIALQSQINPHFLYNTMDTIYWMSEMGDTKDISKIVSNMSRLLRLSIAPNGDDSIPLKEELDHLTCYMEIQKIRYRDSIDFDLQCSVSDDTRPVLRLLLQPLVENALVHGLKEKAFEHIIVRIYEDGPYLIYQIKNDGSLIDVSLIEDILNSETSEIKGFAIRNIDKRLKLKYGNDNGLLYETWEEFSIFTVKQPL